MELALVHVQIRAKKEPLQGEFTSITHALWLLYLSCSLSICKMARKQSNRYYNLLCVCGWVWAHLYYSPSTSQSWTWIFLSMLILGFFFCAASLPAPEL